MSIINADRTNGYYFNTSGSFPPNARTERSFTENMLNYSLIVSVYEMCMLHFANVNFIIVTF